VVGVLSFLVLVQGYRLLISPLGVGTVALGVVALLVGTVSTALTHVIEPRIRESGRS
jgi:hypothetical protein